MASLYYYHGSMGSSKTAQLLMAAKNYEIQGKTVICLKPAVDNRWSEDKIISRSGIESRECIVMHEDYDVFEEVKKASEKTKIYCVLIDEAQFLNRDQVVTLTRIVDDLDIPVMAYGLKNTYKDGELFEGSKYLLFYADKIKEIKTICQFCGRKATMNLRIENGQPVYSGEEVKLGDIVEGENYYIPVCREHYKRPLKRNDII